MTARAVSRIAFSPEPDGTFPSGLRGASKASQLSLCIAFAGDSRVHHLLQGRWGASGVFARSNASALSAGDGTLTLYSNSTAKWAAPGDTAGAVTAVGDGLVWLESATANKGCCFNITSEEVSALGTVGGNPITITIAASSYIGSGEESAGSWAKILSGQKLLCVGSYGIDGETTAGLLRRTSQIFDTDSFGVARSSSVDVVVVDIGTNDVSFIASAEPGYSVETSAANHADICDEITANGAIAVVCSLIRQSPSAGEHSAATSLNTAMASQAASDSRVIMADVYSAVKDPNLTNGNAVANALVGVHWTGYGAKLAGAVVANALKSIVGSSIGRSDFRSGHALSNLVTNGALSGASGSKSGITGDTAVDAIYSGTGTCVASKEVVSGENDWQVYTITGAAADDQLLLLPVMSVTPGSSVYGQVEYIVEGDGVKNIEAIFQFTDDAVLQELVHSNNVSDTPLGLGAMRGVLHVPTIDVPSWEVSSKMLAAATMSAGDTVIKFRDMGAAVA